ncbi:MAG TPA: type II secretion system protein [Terriglobales bacterium]|nr:type II secretion system protein [Terriglobales bacterium]
MNDSKEIKLLVAAPRASNRMSTDVKLPCPNSNPHRRSERGYILITLILFVALIAIATVVMAPIIAFQVKRDREEELIHRGVQYSRAMKYFVKKFGRYPTRIEELENTNQVRFLRKRYKDPITGKEFKILHMGDVQLSFGGGLAGATPVAGLNPGAAGIPGGPGGQGGLGPGAINTMAMAGALSAAGANAAAGPGGPGAGTTVVNGAPGPNSDEEASDDTANAGTGASHAAAGPGAPGSFGTVGQGTSTSGAQVFGGGPMVGVASTSKDKTIRIFNKKDHYYQWQFIYDPTSDRGGLLTTPNQPALQGATSIQGAPGTAGAPGTSTGISGQPGGFGQQPVQPAQPGGLTPQMPPEQP